MCIRDRHKEGNADTWRLPVPQSSRMIGPMLHSSPVSNGTFWISSVYPVPRNQWLSFVLYLEKHLTADSNDRRQPFIIGFISGCTIAVIMENTSNICVLLS